MSSELIIACSLANNKIREIINPYLEICKFDSEMAIIITDYFKNLSGNISIGDFRSFLVSKSLIQTEIAEIITIIKDYILLDNLKIEKTLKVFEIFYKEKLVYNILNEFKGNPDILIQKFKEIKDFSVDSTVYKIVSLNDLNIDKLIEEQGIAVGLESSLDFINKSTPWGGYLLGQVIMVVAAPGSGKTLLMMNEIISFLRQGKKVFWISLADMFELDFIIRMSAIVTKTEYFKVATAPSKYFNENVRKLTENLKLLVLPANFISPEEIVTLVNTRINNEGGCDVIVIDYDSNVKKASDNLYLEGDAVYNAGFHLARPADKKYRLVFIASQPKIFYWDKEKLPKESAGESSRKQAIVDMMLTVGRNPNIRHHHAGIMTVAKNRRGIEGASSPYEVANYGEFLQIDQSRYSLLKTFEA